MVSPYQGEATIPPLQSDMSSSPQILRLSSPSHRAGPCWSKELQVPGEGQRDGHGLQGKDDQGRVDTPISFSSFPPPRTTLTGSSTLFTPLTCRFRRLTLIIVTQRSDLKQFICIPRLPSLISTKRSSSGSVVSVALSSLSSRDCLFLFSD